MVSMGLASTRVAEGGQLRILAQTGPSRHPMLPDVPTTTEAGQPDVRMETWFGLAGPPGMPKEIVARINRELAVIVKQPAFQEKLSKLGLAVDFKPGDDFVAFMNDDTKKWRELIPAMGIPQVD
jgi:tripartite-type tricarboxylate transporter receptor subunit TctC